MSEIITMSSGVVLKRTGEFTWKVEQFADGESYKDWTEYFQVRMDRGQFKDKKK